MKNTIKLFGIIALVAVIGFSFAACGGDDDGGGSGGGGGNGGGGDPIKAKFVGTDWKGSGNYTINFRSVSSGAMAGQGLVNLNLYEGSAWDTYFTISKFETDKFISDRNTVIEYVLSQDGKTLTLSDNRDSRHKFSGEYTKLETQK
jgi:hypothetical protein